MRPRSPWLFEPRPGGPGRRCREAPVATKPRTPRPGGPGRRGFLNRGREAPVAAAGRPRSPWLFEPLVPSRRSGSGYPHSRYPFPPCTARGSAAPLPPSHRGVNHALTVEDDAARRALPTTYDCGSSTRPTSPGPLKFGSDHPAGKPPLTRRPAHPRACDVTRPPGPRMHSSPTCAGPRWYRCKGQRHSTVPPPSRG